MKIIDYFASKKSFSYEFQKKLFDSGMTIGLAGIFWFYSSVVAFPLYLILIMPRNPNHKNLWMICGAITWYVIVFSFVRVLFFIARKRPNKSLRS